MRTADSPSWRPFTSSHLLTSHTTQNYTIWGQFLSGVAFYYQNNLTKKKFYSTIERITDLESFSLYTWVKLSVLHQVGIIILNMFIQYKPFLKQLEPFWTCLNNYGHLGKGFYNSFDQLNLNSSHFAKWLIIKTS